MPDQRDSHLDIVVVDDSDYLRRYIASTLENENFHVAGQASSAEEGMRLSVTSDANLFIVDILMPQKSGFDLLQAMLENNYRGYVIITSFLNTDNVVIEAFRNGAVDFLRKPILKEELIKSIKKIDRRIKEGKS